MGWKSRSFQALPSCVTVSKHRQGKSAPSTGVGASPNTLHQRVLLVTLHRLHRRVCARSPTRRLLILSPVACATLARLLHGTVPTTLSGMGVGRVARLRSGLCSRRWSSLCANCWLSALSAPCPHLEGRCSRRLIPLSTYHHRLSAGVDTHVAEENEQTIRDHNRFLD